jgi:hypothetical protein
MKIYFLFKLLILKENKKEGAVREIERVEEE